MKTTNNSDTDKRLCLVDRYVRAHWVQLGLSKSKREDWGPRLLDYNLEHIERALNRLVAGRRKFSPMWGDLLDALDATCIRQQETPQEIQKGMRDTEREAEFEHEAEDKRRATRADEFQAEKDKLAGLPASMREHLHDEVLRENPGLKGQDVIVQLAMRLMMKKLFRLGTWTDALVKAAREGKSKLPKPVAEHFSPDAPTGDSIPF